MRRVAFVVNSRANYARIKTAIRECTKNEHLDVLVFVGASGVLHRFGDVSKLVENDGFTVTNKIFSVVEGNEPISMVKTTALSLLSLADEFRRTKPHVAVTVADRHETIATAIAASYMNIVVAHTQGGELTGSIDDNVRHAISKLSHIHFPATQTAEEILVRMGEDPNSIFRVGCPAIDLAHETPRVQIKDILPRYFGVGAQPDYSKPYLLVSQHPDTLQYEEARHQITETLEAVHSLKIQTLWLWPNVDSGADAISKKLREFRELNPSSMITFFRNFSAEDYINVLRGAACIVGNSSSGIREASFLGKPSVNIGERQRGRQKGPNVVDVEYSREQIAKAIEKQVGAGSYQPDKTYGDGFAGESIAKILSSYDLSIRKKTAYS